MKAAQGRIPVFLDGGVRRGTDVFKALALGASGIFVSILKISKACVSGISVIVSVFCLMSVSVSVVHSS